MSEPTYGPNGAAPGFNRALDLGLHGDVHVAVGGPTNMGSVPWAANDAIFWLHHCNIDRIWASWNAAGRTNPEVDQSNRTFVFADANGARVEAMVSEFSAIAPLRYSYDALEPLPGGTSPMMVAAVATEATPAPTVLAAPPEVAPIELGAEPVRIKLAPTVPAAGGAPESLAEGLRAMPASGRVYLVLEGVTAAEQPGILYSVYPNLPEGTAGSPESRSYVGALNFFNVMPGHAEHGDEGLTVSFNVTDLVREIGAENAQPEVTLVPEGAPVDASRPIVGGLRLVAQP